MLTYGIALFKIFVNVENREVNEYIGRSVGVSRAFLLKFLIVVVNENDEDFNSASSEFVRNVFEDEDCHS